MAISVVVPIYNSESFLMTCINSLLNQSYKDFELILVDDGSEDLSGKLCDEFEKKDERIKVIHQKNKGVTCARLAGIKASCNDLISFVDADDWIDEHFLECLVASMESTKADIVISGCLYEEKEKTTASVNLIKAGIYEGTKLVDNVISRMLYYEGFYKFGIQPYMCNKLFHKDLLLACFQEIDTMIYDGEDVAIIYPYLLKSKKVIITEDCMYHYRIHRNSASHLRRKDFYENVSRLYLQLYKSCKKSEYFKLMLPQMDQYLRLMVWEGIPRDILEEDKIFFPFGKVPGGCNIILYGAGLVGRTFYRQIKKTNYCNVISWVDRDYIELSLQGMSVESPDIIITKKFDYIIIAQGKRNVQEEIKAYLNSLGISEKQMIAGELLEKIF